MKKYQIIKALILVITILSCQNVFASTEVKYLNDAVKLYNIDEEFINVYGDSLKHDLLIENQNNVNITSKYVKVVYQKDLNGNVINTEEKEISKNEAKNLINYNKNLQTGLQSINNTIYETNVKYIIMQYYDTPKETVVDLWNFWKTTPKIKSVDVIAVRFEKNVDIIEATGSQMDSTGKSQSYSYKGNNMKTFSNGVGISMNLFDDGKQHVCKIQVKRKNTSDFINVYGSYQHAKVGVKLSTSQQYSLSNQGLGNVIKFNTQTISSYYDGMQGLVLDHFAIHKN